MARYRSLLVFAISCVIAAVVPAADAQQSPGGSAQGLLSRRTSAVTYEARRTTKIDLTGTPLMPRTRGEAEIKTESAGPVWIKAKVRGLTSPSQFGAEYLTFVLWAIPPQGRAKNLGEIRLDEGRDEIEASSDVQTFALIVTAEPYYAVTTPSEVVVMENAIREETRGRTSIATLEYEIVPRGAYIAGGPFGLAPPSSKEPPDVQQARNAVAIAQIAQAEKFVPDGIATSRRLLSETELLVKRKESKRDIISHARATVQAAERSAIACRRIAGRGRSTGPTGSGCGSRAGGARCRDTRSRRARGRRTGTPTCRESGAGVCGVEAARGAGRAAGGGGAAQSRRSPARRRTLARRSGIRAC
jgi:hypothetical protein